MSQFMSKNDGTGTSRTSHCLQQLGAGVGPSACSLGGISLAWRPPVLHLVLRFHRGLVLGDLPSCQCWWGDALLLR